jgi:hypothetical protein
LCAKHDPGTPLNTALLLYIVYAVVFPPPPTSFKSGYSWTPKSHPPGVLFTTYTPKTLEPFNGKDGCLLSMASCSMYHRGEISMGHVCDPSCSTSGLILVIQIITVLAMFQEDDDLGCFSRLDASLLSSAPDKPHQTAIPTLSLAVSFPCNSLFCIGLTNGHPACSRTSCSIGRSHSEAGADH